MNAGTTIIRSRINESEKEKAEKIFDAIGLTTSDALRMFIRQVILHRGIPFEMKIPNKKTLEAIKGGHQPGDKLFDSAADLLEDLGLDDD